MVTQMLFFFPRIIGSDVITKNFEIDKRSGHISIAKGSSLDVNHLNGENLFFGVEVSEPQTWCFTKFIYVYCMSRGFG